MKHSVFIGIDVSKKTIDAAVKEEGVDSLPHKQFSNDQKGFRLMIKWIRRQHQCSDNELFFCMEHTGVYVLPLCSFLSEKGLSYCLENPLQIKESMGIIRGKNDKADSKVIARYAFTHCHELLVSNFPASIILKLQCLLAYRDRIIKAKVAQIKASGELVDFTEKEVSKYVMQDSRSMIRLLNNRKKKVEKEIKLQIEANDEVLKNFNLITSVSGIGNVTAAYIIVFTQNFKTFKNARKFACYSGVAPFDHSSGTSYNKGVKVSHLANKKVKTLLTSCAWSAVKTDNELRAFYQRKIKQGKNKMSSLNIIRNKLIFRMFAVIKRQTPYVKIATY